MRGIAFNLVDFTMRQHLKISALWITHHATDCDNVVIFIVNYGGVVKSGLLKITSLFYFEMLFNIDFKDII